MRLTGYLASLATGIIIFTGAGEAAETKMPVAKNKPPVAIDAMRVKKTRVGGGDFDDKTQVVQLEVVAKLTNLNARKVEGLKLHYWVFAQSVVDRKICKVIDSGVVDVKLDDSAEGREMRVEGKEVTLKLDDTAYAKFGETYKGYLLVLLNDQKEVVAVKSTVPSWQTNFERAFDLKTGSNCDMALKAPGSK